MLNIAGIIGVIIPALPGVMLNYIALILLYIERGEIGIQLNTLIMFGLLTISMTFLDYALPLLGAKKFGVSRSGILGAAIGMLLGLWFFPPFGFMLGLLLGAFIGELISGQEQSQAFKSGLITFLGGMISIIIKLILAITMMIFFLSHAF